MDLLPFEPVFLGGSYSAGPGVPSVPAERSLFPPFAHENGFLSWPTSSCPGQAECLPKTSTAQFTGAIQNPPAVSSHWGRGKKTNCTVNPFPTKSICRRRSAWVGSLLAHRESAGREPVILRTDERDPEVAPSYLGKKYLLSFSVKTIYNFVFLFRSLGYTQIAA